jgi:hypothetical protein
MPIIHRFLLLPLAGVPLYNPAMTRPPLLLALLLGAAAPAAFAGTAAVSEKPYEDKGIGYSILPIRGWEAKPKKNPDDPLAQNQAGGWYSKDPAWRGAECQVLRFGSFFGDEDRDVATEETGDGGAKDPVKPPEQGAPPRTAKEMFGKGPKSFAQWLELVDKGMAQRGQRIDLTPTPAKFGDDEGKLWEGRVVLPDSRKVLLYGASVKRGAFEVAVLYEAPEGKDFVRDLKGAFKASTRSLRILSEKTMRKADDAMAKKLQGVSAEAAWAEKAIANLPPGWKHSKTEHYVVLYDKSVDFTNPGLIARIGNQLEKIRAQVYEPMFPAARPVTALSIVKVTQDRQQYLAYNAPEGSAGYWSWPSRELVFYCEPGSRAGVDLTLDVLNHEGFHQYIFYAVGQVSPHSWFNEGHGDFFAGYNLSEGKFKQGKFAWRQPVIQEAIENRTYVPLDKFLTFTQAEYYRRGQDKVKGESVRQNYAQGWSLIYFLRTTKDPRYTPILGRYFDTLKAGVAAWRTAEDEAAAAEGRAPAEITPPDVDKKASDDALKAAFEGVDIQQLEKDWIASKPY